MIEEKIAKKLTDKVKNEFDTTVGLRTEDIEQEIAHNGGEKEE
jgi:hypothetical protein